MREERASRRQMEIELRNTYDLTPIGLFTLNGEGRFIRANPALHSMLGLPQEDYSKYRWTDYFAGTAERDLSELLQRDDSASIEIEGAAGADDRRAALFAAGNPKKKKKKKKKKCQRFRRGLAGRRDRSVQSCGATALFSLA